MKKYAIQSGLALALLCMPITAWAMGVNVQVVTPTDEVVVGVQEYPGEDYIPYGDYTPPPPLAIQEPELVVVPSAEEDVYMVPDMVGVYFYNGYWYRYHHGVWFRSYDYNAPWIYVQLAVVPIFVRDIPPAYPLYLPRNYYRVHYRDLNDNWREWSRDRHWHGQSWYQDERRDNIRNERIRQANLKMEQERSIRQERIRERDQQKQREIQQSRERDQQKQRDMQQERERDQQKQREIQQSRERDQQKQRDMQQGRERDQQKQREVQQTRDRDQQKQREVQQGREREQLKQQPEQKKRDQEQQENKQQENRQQRQ
jgi:hypothetical protein